MAEHPKAELLHAIAKGERIEVKYPGKNIWEPITGGQALCVIAYHPDQELRIKPKTILINGIKIPEPLQEWPEDEALEVYIALTMGIEFHVQCTVAYAIRYHPHALARGFVHTTKEAAISHSKALISFSKKELY